MFVFKKFLKENLLPFAYASTVLGSAYLGYITFKIRRNYSNFSSNQNNEDFKDTTRLDYDFYGLNWGAASDNMVINLKSENEFIRLD